MATKTTTLDRLDMQILSLLLGNGRITTTQIADQIGLSITPCAKRIRKLEKTKIIGGYRAELNMLELFDLSCFRVQLTLNKYSLETAIAFESKVLETSEIIECEATLGEFDYLLLVATTNTDHYQRLIEQLLTSTEGGFDYRTYVVSKSIKTQSAKNSVKLFEFLQTHVSI